MPRATHRLADHETFGERPVVMRAMGADRENLVLPGAPAERPRRRHGRRACAVGELSEFNALHQIGAVRRVLRVAHRSPFREFFIKTRQSGLQRSHLI